MASVCLLVLCGIPGAGKSTWAKQFSSYARELEDNSGINEQLSTGLNVNGLDDKADRKGAGEGTGQRKGRETYRVIHIAYDDLIPEELEAELIHGAQNHSKETKSARWKTYRRAIVRCVDDLVAELSNQSNTLPGYTTSDGQAATHAKIKVPVKEGDATGDVRQDSRCKEGKQEYRVVDDSSVHQTTNTLSLIQLTDDNSSQIATFLGQINNCPTKGPVACANDSGELEESKSDDDDGEKISYLDSMEVVPDFLRVIFNDVVKRQIKGGSNSVIRWVLVIDDNMYYSSMRYEYYQLARKHATGFAQVYFPVDLTTALHRNQARERHVDESVIHDMLNRLERPPCEETSWQKYTAISENADRSGFENVLRLIDEAMSHPVMPLSEDKAGADESRSICLASLLHQADVALRKILGEHMATAKDVVESKTERSRMAAASNLIRKEILDDLRSRTLAIPDGIVIETSTNVEDPFHSYLKSIFLQRLKTLSSKFEIKC